MSTRSARAKARSAASCSRLRPGCGACLRTRSPSCRGTASTFTRTGKRARALVRKLGYGPDNRLKIKVTTRDWSVYRDPALLLIDQLRQIYIDGELDVVDTAQYFPKIQRKEYTVALNLQTAGPDPDPTVQLFYGCGSNLNWDNYCNPEMDKMIEAQSREGDADKRKQILWTIERKLADDN